MAARDARQECLQLNLRLNERGQELWHSFPRNTSFGAWSGVEMGCSCPPRGAWRVHTSQQITPKLRASPGLASSYDDDVMTRRPETLLAISEQIASKMHMTSLPSVVVSGTGRLLLTCTHRRFRCKACREAALGQYMQMLSWKHLERRSPCCCF